MAEDRRGRRGGEDFSESEMTLPAMAQLRRGAPRIATPLATELKAGPAPARANPRRDGPSPSTTLPLPTQVVAPNLSQQAAAVPSPVTQEKSARMAVPVPNPVAPERLSRNVAPLPAPTPSPVPAPAATEASARATVPAMAAPERHVRTAAASAIERVPSSAEVVAQQAAHAAALLAQSESYSNDTTRSTLASPPPTVGRNGDLVRVHRLPTGERHDARLFMLHAADSPAAASFRVLRHRLGERKELKTILVTSANPGEGKTTCALNLALALGEAGRAKVLLVEANLRRPVLARVLGFRPPVCFSEQLEMHRAQPMQPWVVVENLNPWLHTAAMAPDAQSRPLLDGPALALAMEQLREANYDYIVLDTPSILGSADVNIIEENVDGILITAVSRRTRARALKKAVAQIGADKVLGVVMIGS